MPDLPFRIPNRTPPQDQRPAPVETFTHNDALEWLGVSREAYERAVKAGDGGDGPLNGAMLDARAANSTDPRHARPGIQAGVTTAAAILSGYGIDPKHPEIAVAAELKQRSKYWS